MVCFYVSFFCDKRLYNHNRHIDGVWFFNVLWSRRYLVLFYALSGFVIWLLCARIKFGSFIGWGKTKPAPNEWGPSWYLVGALGVVKVSSRCSGGRGVCCLFLHLLMCSYRGSLRRRCLNKPQHGRNVSSYFLRWLA